MNNDPTGFGIVMHSDFGGIESQIIVSARGVLVGATKGDSYAIPVDQHGLM